MVLAQDIPQDSNTNEIYPALFIHNMYQDTGVCKHERITVTRLRLSSHDLAIDNRKGGVVVEN